jgi:hypothetical protein
MECGFALEADNVAVAFGQPRLPVQSGMIACLSCPSTGITAYLNAGGTLDNVQAMAAHESPRTTKLYDRIGDEITLDEVERIAI